MRITEWLKLLATRNGSDLYLSTGAPPCAKFEGKLTPIDSEILRPGEIKEIAYEIMDSTQQAEFEKELEMNLATSISGCPERTSILVMTSSDTPLTRTA